jgi:hypothetical protein
MPDITVTLSEPEENLLVAMNDVASNNNVVHRRRMGTPYGLNEAGIPAILRRWHTSNPPLIRRPTDHEVVMLPEARELARRIAPGVRSRQQYQQRIGQMPIREAQNVHVLVPERNEPVAPAAPIPLARRSLIKAISQKLNSAVDALIKNRWFILLNHNLIAPLVIVAVLSLLTLLGFHVYSQYYQGATQPVPPIQRTVPPVIPNTQSTTAQSQPATTQSI